MPSRWIDIHRSADDAHIGQTVLRLAGLAAAVHRGRHAATLPDQDHLQMHHGAEGLDPESVTAAVDASAVPSRLALVHTAIDDGPGGAAEGTAIHKEVNR